MRTLTIGTWAPCAIGSVGGFDFIDSDVVVGRLSMKRGLEIPAPGCGVVTLEKGKATVQTPLAFIGTMVLIARESFGSSPGHLSAIASDGSIAITSSSATDDGAVRWWVVNRID